MTSRYVRLSRHENQARGLAQYALDFVSGRIGQPDEAVWAKLEQFHLDSVACAVAALAVGANAPRLLREEALGTTAQRGACCFGSNRTVSAEKAVVANCAAVRELDANGTNFGYNPRTGCQRGEFGHNDFYPVAIAGAQATGADGLRAARAMLCLDEIRGRLAEVFGLKDYKVDHVLHGAIASAAAYGALAGATVDQIESAIGMVVAHYVPFRAIRHGEQLSDSKGASAALSAETAVLAMGRAMRGFIGPADIFRNPQSIFCLFEPPLVRGTSPFDLELAVDGDDFAIMGMHFKLGLYEHQSAGAIAGLIELLGRHPALLSEASAVRRVVVTIYEPAFSIIGDPHKRDPRTRQSADHSMVYIIATLLRKAIQLGRAGWQELMLMPNDYSPEALGEPLTRELMSRIDFRHGGPQFDALYPDGIPTTVEIEHAEIGHLASELIMYPEGHARSRSSNLARLLEHKFDRLAALGVSQPASLRDRLGSLRAKSPEEIKALYSFPLQGLSSP